jgi:bifunctional N-acetylglucosamine-1-phosphate-uridyltransferase/glucosamine-1-phosphate-acetyltransferase GlmU-like protein
MTRIVNIMPMAGLGKRFFKSDFHLPKPLIPIKDKPMFIQAAKCMPKSKLNIFICNKKLVKHYNIKKILSKEFRNKYKLITVKRTTKGQANTCLLAKKFLKKNDKIFIHSCDSFIKFNSSAIKKDLGKFKGIIYTTKPNKTHIKNIKSYGWVNLKNNEINKITCKKRASPAPDKDFVIIGTFAFQNKSIFIKLTKELIQSKQTVNNEYYLDMVLKLAVENKNKIKNIKVKKYFSWGTPNELYNWKNKFEKKIYS